MKKTNTKTATTPPPQAAFTFGPSLLDITCGKCGHQADAEEWTKDRLGFDLGPREFQCPKCSFAFRIVTVKRDGWKSGFNSLELIAPRL